MLYHEVVILLNESKSFLSRLSLPAIGTRATAPPYLDECAILQQTKKALQWSAR